jgi:molecular chaperone GrpE
MMRPNEFDPEEREERETMRVSDRRRFRPDGTRREDPSAGEGEPTEGGEEQPRGRETHQAEEAGPAPAEETPPAPEPEVVPAWEAREWERRALEAETKIRDITDAYRRHKHELEGVRKRLERDQEARVEEALARTFTRLLEPLDMLDLALSHAEEGPFKDGVRLVLRKMLEALEEEGVERIETQGKPFDPAVAEAVAMVPVEDAAQHNHVVAEMRAGYRMGERILRPAQVQVGLKSS